MKRYRIRKVRPTIHDHVYYEVDIFRQDAQEWVYVHTDGSVEFCEEWIEKANTDFEPIDEVVKTMEVK